MQFYIQVLDQLSTIRKLNLLFETLGDFHKKHNDFGMKLWPWTIFEVTDHLR